MVAKHAAENTNSRSKYNNDRRYIQEPIQLRAREEAEIFWSRPYDKYSLASQKDHIPPLSLKQRFLDILRGSPQIRELLVNTINDCMVYHDQTKEVMDNISAELSTQSSSRSSMNQ